MDTTELAVATVYRDFSAAQVLFHTTIADVIGLSASDYKCLDLLMRATGPVTATALAQMCGLTTGPEGRLRYAQVCESPLQASHQG